VVHPRWQLTASYEKLVSLGKKGDVRLKCPVFEKMLETLKSETLVWRCF